jgi:predicted nucleic acid-binding protein
VLVLRRPRIAPRLALFFLDGSRRVYAVAELVTIIEPVTGCRDPDDDKFLELAVNGLADAIISGGRDLLAPSTFRGVPIIAPAAFARAEVR